MAAPAIAQPTQPSAPPSVAQPLRMAGFALLALLGAACLALWHPDWYRPIAYIQAGLLVLKCGTYLAAARACLYLQDSRIRSILFALINLCALTLFFDAREGRRQVMFFLAAYLSMAAFHYAALKAFALRGGWRPWLAFLSPIAALAVLRYLPFLFQPVIAAIPGVHPGPLAVFFIGVSYMAFRLSLLAIEVRNRVVPMPDFARYLGFAFFLPTLVVGPIYPYSVHHRSLESPDRTVTPVGRSWLRIIIGAAKYQFLGNIFNQMSYSALLLDGHTHPPIDLLVAAVCYHLYLYCNFSGFCDMGIGAAGLLGIQVKENFRNPLGARSVQDYWNRWHITLSTYMRDVVFSPLSRSLAGRMGARRANHAIAMSIVIVFLIVGVWHGVGWQFATYGAIHAVGVVTNHYYTIWLKTRLGRDRFKAYHENRWITACAVSATFLYVTASLFFFANDFATMRSIFDAIR